VLARRVRATGNGLRLVVWCRPELDESPLYLGAWLDPEHPDRVLMVASDRVSAFDHVLEPVIPGKRADIRERSALIGMHLLRILLSGAEPPL